MYITVEEANEYVSNYYSSTDPLRLSWDALSLSDKQVALNRAELLIDQLPFQGKALQLGKAFPREPHKEESLAKAKIATVELAVQRLDNERNQRADMQKQGVKSYKIGDLSETFKDAEGSTDFDSLAFSIVRPFLSAWLSGGYTICPTQTNRLFGLHKAH